MLKTVGPYQVKAQIGGGGETVVFRAQNPEQQRDVAIKLIGRQFIDESGLARLQEHVQTLYDLNHPAIVPIEDLDALQGNPYLVTQYMPGGTLSERVARGPLPLEEAASILNRIAAALDMIHQQGIIHPDLAPDTILFDADGQAYLGGFGSLRPGDLATVSPEQIEGEPVNRQSNIYSLGAILFHMLTGQPVNTAAAQQSRPIPSIHMLRPDLPSDLDDVMRQALAQKPEERFDSATAMVSALAEMLDEPEAADVADVESTFASFLESLEETRAQSDDDASTTVEESLNYADWEPSEDFDLNLPTEEASPATDEFNFDEWLEQQDGQEEEFQVESEFLSEETFLSEEEFVSEGELLSDGDEEPANFDESDYLPDTDYLSQDDFLSEEQFLTDDNTLLSSELNLAPETGDIEEELRAALEPAATRGVKPRRKRSVWPWIIGILVFLILAVAVVAFAWMVASGTLSLGTLPGHVSGPAAAIITFQA